MVEATITAGMAKTIMKDGDQRAQTNSGMRSSVMPGARILKMVTMIADRHRQARQLGIGDHLRPDVGALADAILRAGQRHIAEPAGVRAAVDEEGDPQHHAAEQIDPVAEGVEARKGDGARAEHQRHQIDADGLHHRHGEQEHHGRAVHGEKLVVEVRARPACSPARRAAAASPAPTSPPRKRKISAVTT